MKLHENQNSFRLLIRDVGRSSGIRQDIIEKDYYLTLLLSELAGRQSSLPAYFKGGTALYKALRSIGRFSEDIDLTVEVQDCSRSQGKKRLELSANGYQSLPRTSDKAAEENRKGSITSVYTYVPVTEVDDTDTLQRFGNVKVEATSFNISEPVESLQIEPLLYTHANAKERQWLQDQYGLGPFPIKTIKMERIFADKILAAEFYYQRRELFDVSKHLYDLTVMTGVDRIRQMLADNNLFIRMLAYKRSEETVRTGSDLATKPFSEFTLFARMQADTELESAFYEMQRVYVFQEKDRMAFEHMARSMWDLHGTLLSLNEPLKMDTGPTNAFDQHM